METLKSIFTEANLPFVISLVGPAVLAIIGWLFKAKKDRADTIFRTGVGIAFNVVNDVSKMTPNTIDDKAALALGYLDQFLGTYNQKMSPADEERAKLMFKALHGSETPATAPATTDPK